MLIFRQASRQVEPSWRYDGNEQRRMAKTAIVPSSAALIVLTRLKDDDRGQQFVLRF